MAIFPPQERIWWKEPIEGTELIWIALAFIWGVIMFAMMPYWHVVGEQNPPQEAYRIDPAAFEAKTEEMAAQYTVREEGDTEIPVVHPPAGADAYMLGRLWEWWPILELEKGQTYRLHLSSLDWLHGFSLQPTNINLQIHPGYDMVVTLTPTESGEFGVVCNEFCGAGHHTMLGKIYVVD
jgi:cytochrome c oxidase subunit 2